ncbi:MAG: O-antigen ligase family protein [Thermogutta sp.]|nr:O-antigen ligase family protein [Thermogutta sp.]
MPQIPFHDSSSGTQSLWVRLCDQGLDALQPVCLFGVPLMMGGRHPLGHLLLVTTAGTMLLLWCLRRGLSARSPFTWTGAEWLAAAGVLLLGLQLVPMPPAVLSRLSPAVPSFLPLWFQQGNGALGAWPYLSLMPEETRLCLILFLSYFAVFWVTAQRIRTIADVERIFRYLAWAVTVVAGLGVLQHVAGNDKFFWFYQHPYSTTADAVKGCFTNRNHFADFLALGIGPLLWWALGGGSAVTGREKGGAASRRGATRAVFSWSGSGKPAGPDAFSSHPAEGRWLRMVLLGTVLFAGLLSLSRAGNVVLALALMITAAALYRGRILRPQGFAVLGFAVVLTAAALAIFGRDRVAERLDDLAALSWETLDRQASRTTVWRNTWRAAEDFPLVGSGAGSFRFVQALYEGPRSHAEYYSHAEQSYLQVLLETGWPGLGLLLCGWILVFVRAGRAAIRGPDPRHRMAAATAAAGLVAHALHGLVDFVFYVPGLTVTAVTLAACVWRLGDFAADSASTRRRGIANGTSASPGNQRIGESASPGRETKGVSASLGKELIGASAKFDTRRIGASASPGKRRIAAGGGSTAEERGTAASRRLVWSAAALCVAVLTGVVVADRLPAVFAQQMWERYLILRRASESASMDAWLQDGESPPERPAESERRVIELLTRAAEAEPRWAEPHLRLAQAYLRRFHALQLGAENAMPLSQIRDAAVQSRFPSAAALEEWLAAAVGEHRRLLYLARHEADQAVRLCPLLGEAYLVLGELGFLRGEGDAELRQWTAQALRAAPYNGNILFEAGLQAFLAGDEAGWIDYWRRAFHAGRLHQRRLIRQLAGRASPEHIAEETEFLLRVFEPDLEAVRFMYRYYRKSYPAENLGPLAEAYLSALQSQIAGMENDPAAEAQLRLESHFILLERGDKVGALEAARQAAALDPNDYRSHHYLSQRLEELGHWAEAEEHVRWCLLRRPGHRPLERRLAALRERQLSGAALPPAVAARETAGAQR